MIFFGAIYVVLFKEFISIPLRDWCLGHNISFDLAQYLLGFIPCIILVSLGVGIAKGSKERARPSPGKDSENYMEKLLAGRLSPQLALFGYYLPFCAISILTGRYAKVGATGFRLAEIDIGALLTLLMFIIFQVVTAWGVWKSIEKTAKGSGARLTQIALISSAFAVIASWFMWS